LEADQYLAKVRVAGSNPVVRSKKVLVRAPGGASVREGARSPASSSGKHSWQCVCADPVTGRRRSVYETVRAPDTRAGAKLAGARLAELITAVESGVRPEPVGRGGLSVADLAGLWQEAHRPRQHRRSGDWMGWSPKTAMTVGDNFRSYLLSALAGDAPPRSREWSWTGCTRAAGRA
jgi:hypothetical protein